MAAESTASLANSYGQTGANRCEDDSADRPLVLVVDDEALNRTILSAILHRLGYRTHVAVNGRAAVEATRSQAYAAVLMDCLMPEMDGYDATRMIRQDELACEADTRRRRVPVIAVTAVAFNGARERCIAAGMDDYLSKPVIPQDLATVLDRWIRGAEEQATWDPERAEDDVLDVDRLVDLDVLESLRELGAEDGDAFVAGVVLDFMTDVLPRFQVIRAAIAREDRPVLLQALHAVAGCAAMVGALQVEELARSFPVDDVFHDAQSAGERIDHLHEVFTRTCQLLESLANLHVHVGAPGSTSD